CIDIKILVAALVLGKQDIFAVPAPEIDANRACGVVGDGPGGAEWLGSPLDPDVASAFVGLDEGNELPIRRDLAAGYFGIAKEQLAIDDGRLPVWPKSTGAGRRETASCQQ